MIRWSQLPLGDLTIATLISLETAGFIGNKYGPFYSFVYMFSVVFVIIFLISLDAAKRNSKLEKITTEWTSRKGKREQGRRGVPNSHRGH